MTSRYSLFIKVGKLCRDGVLDFIHALYNDVDSCDYGDELVSSVTQFYERCFQ
jgi:hypothetical protein